MDPRVRTAVDRGDLDELVRCIDALCERGEWDALGELRSACAQAFEQTGRQMWPAASHAEYRLALEAPPAWAATVLVEGAGRFALGPLPEVVAATHTWPDLAPHVPPGPPAVVALHERVVRGEDLRDTTLPGPPVLDLPLALAAWEPRYALAHYEAHAAHFPSPHLPRPEPVPLPAPPGLRTTDGASSALAALVDTWTTRSDGRVETVVVDGDARAAVAALGPSRARTAPLSAADAIAAMAWAAASGGAHGPRPGAAAGRFAAWWALAALAGMADEWPVDADRLGTALTRLEWFHWDAAEPVTGWALHLAVHDASRGIAWAVAAVDAR